MSSSQSQFPQPSQSASSSPNQPDAQALPPESVPLAETSMDQHLASTLMMDSSAASSSPEETFFPTPDLPDSSADVDDSLSTSALETRQQPIPPASEPMQYRAIGLVKGKYTPLEEQFTRGTVLTEDGTAIDAVLLGRVMSLVKKHLDLEQSHLWVVYPRTRDKDNDLHVQIVGVWEPEKLSKLSESDEAILQNSDASDSGDRSSTNAEVETETDPDAEARAEGEAASASNIDAQNPQDGYFSIRGEILYYAPEDERLIVKIQQSPRKGAEMGKSFKLNLKGTLNGKAVGYFWDLNVQRQENLLVVQDGTLIALVPPKKRTAPGGGHKKRRSGPPGPARKRWDGPREGQRQMGGDRPSVAAPPSRKGPLPKPVKKAKDQSNPG